MESPASMGDLFLAKIYEVIEDNLENENFTVEELANTVGLSRSMLHRKLVKLTKKSASDLITEKRLTRAMELLENDAATASEIAYQVGFSSPSYFNKVFKNYFQISPGEVRKGVPSDFSSSKPSPGETQNNIYRKRSYKRLVILVTSIFIVLASLGITYYLKNEKKSIEKSIAILPFDNLSLYEENQFLADGIVEDLLNRLSSLKNLKVISRTSSEMFRNKGNKTVPEIAKLLDVNYILEGSVQRHADKIRINIQLIDGKKDNHILSKQYDRNLKEFFKTQSEIAGQIANELSIVINESEIRSLNQTKTNNLKAFEYYQMGRFYSSKRLGDGYKKGIEFYEKAIAEDPDYGLAYAGLADNYHLMALQGWMDETEGRKKATEISKKALKLDPDLASPHAVLGSLYQNFDQDWDKAEKEFKKAIELDPNYSTAHQYYAELLSVLGYEDQARKEINKALELDPYSFVIRYFSALFYFNEEKFNEALAENNICFDLVPEHPWSINLAYHIYQYMDSMPKAIFMAKKFAGAPGIPTAEQIDSLYENEGIKGLIKWLIKYGDCEPDFDCAILHAALNEREETLELLEKAADVKSGDLCGSIIGMQRLEFKFLRSDPRFNVVRKRMNLPPIK